MSISVIPGTTVPIFSDATSPPSFGIALKLPYRTPTFTVSQDGAAVPIGTGYLVPIYFSSGCQVGWSLELYLNGQPQAWVVANIVQGPALFALRSAGGPVLATPPPDQPVPCADFCVPIQMDQGELCFWGESVVTELHLGPQASGFSVVKCYEVATGAALPADIWSVTDAVPAEVAHLVGGGARHIRITLEHERLNDQWRKEQAEEARKSRYQKAAKTIADRADTAPDCKAETLVSALRDVQKISDNALKPVATRFVHGLLSGVEIALVIQADAGDGHGQPAMATAYLRLCSTLKGWPGSRG